MGEGEASTLLVLLRHHVLRGNRTIAQPLRVSRVTESLGVGTTVSVSTSDALGMNVVGVTSTTIASSVGAVRTDVSALSLESLELSTQATAPSMTSR